jgi:hypothetical protein
VRYELEFSIPEEDILDSQSHENPKSYINHFMLFMRIFVDYRGCDVLIIDITKSSAFRGITQLPKHYTLSYPRRKISSLVGHCGNETKNLTILRNGVFWDVTPCGSCENRRLGGT